MQIIGATHTNINIFTDPGQRIKLTGNTAHEASTAVDKHVFVDKHMFSDMDSGVAELSRQARENNIKHMTREREEFYMADKTLEYKPGGLSVRDEIRLATQSGYTSVNADGSLGLSFSVGLVGNNSSLAPSTNSPLNFETKVNNLKSLFEHLGDNALNYTAEFESALNGIIDDFLSTGGRYVTADKEGVAESIRAMFNGEEGKYSADDLKIMAVLSFESVVTSYPTGASEFKLGALLGFDALSIQMARNAGRLSDAAYATVKDAFNAHASELIKQMDEYLEWAKNDPFMPKDVTYSSARPELVQKAIDFMLGALNGDDFNQGIRAALRTLEDMYNAQRESQLENVSVDQRFNLLFFSRSTRTSLGDAIEISSRFLSEYLNRPEWAVSGSVFSVSVTV
jgi:hypothetical protein